MIRNKTAWGDVKSTVGASKSTLASTVPREVWDWGVGRCSFFSVPPLVCFTQPRKLSSTSGRERKARDQPKAPAVNVNIGGETCQNELRNQSPPSCRHKICCEASVACPGALRRRHASVMRLGALHTIQKQLGRPSHDGNKLARLLQALCTGILV